VDQLVDEFARLALFALAAFSIPSRFPCHTIVP
jgi:hypothetical protein